MIPGYLCTTLRCWRHVLLKYGLRKFRALKPQPDKKESRGKKKQRGIGRGRPASCCSATLAPGRNQALKHQPGITMGHSIAMTAFKPQGLRDCVRSSARPYLLRRIPKTVGFYGRTKRV